MKMKIRTLHTLALAVVLAAGCAGPLATITDGSTHGEVRAEGPHLVIEEWAPGKCPAVPDKEGDTIVEIGRPGPGTTEDYNISMTGPGPTGPRNATIRGDLGAGRIVIVMRPKAKPTGALYTAEGAAEIIDTTGQVQSYTVPFGVVRYTDPQGDCRKITIIASGHDAFAEIFRRRADAWISKTDIQN